MKELVGYSERRVRAVVAELPDGEYNYTDYVDGCGDKYPDPLPIKVKVTIKGDNLTIDFTGTADQIKAPINVPYPCTKAAVFFAVKALMATISQPMRESTVRSRSLLRRLHCKSDRAEPDRRAIDCQQRIPDAIFGARSDLPGYRGYRRKRRVHHDDLSW